MKKYTWNFDEAAELWCNEDYDTIEECPEDAKSHIKVNLLKPIMNVDDKARDELTLKVDVSNVIWREWKPEVLAEWKKSKHPKLPGGLEYAKDAQKTHAARISLENTDLKGEYQ